MAKQSSKKETPKDINNLAAFINIALTDNKIPSVSN
jgi:hypothetical protein